MLFALTANKSDNPRLDLGADLPQIPNLRGQGLPTKIERKLGLLSERDAEVWLAQNFHF
jgi:hypothetical protein